MTAFSVKKRMKMSANKAWNVFSDFEHSPIATFTVTVEEKGESDSNGIGTIRIITIGSRQFRERLEALIPPNSLTYSLLSGAPVRNYTGNIDIKSIRNETLITWKVQFKPKIIGTGWIVKWLAKNTINHILKEIEEEYQD
ncbi:MAG: SRPBCC family protein [Deltaproteobacteria bacterium]|nr:SRPBCC family protein [Deltaproteobacteria bacterium]